MKALVVDDSLVMRRILISALKMADVTEIDEAGDGQEAVDAVMKEDYSIVLLDWNMPVMLGIDALKAIRAAGKNVPVIMVTTEAERVRVLEALRAGAMSYVIKPFEAAAIVEKIKLALSSNPQQ
jgi:two-component system chemotaxis response regulator CheY